jgi:hypothetical protein
MRVDALVVALRPRSMWEAADLGIRLVQANAGSVWRTTWPMFLVVLALTFASDALGDWAPVLVIFWCKPWLDRGLLFVLSRAVFGESTRPADLWRARKGVLWKRPIATLTTLRLSPWRTFVLPIDQLEGQRGAALRARRSVMLRGQGASAMLLQFAFANLELFLSLGIWSLFVWFAPEGHHAQALSWIGKSAKEAWVFLPYFAVVVFLEPFFVGAGFAMYLNRRVQLEAWDVEQEFRHVFA